MIDIKLTIDGVEYGLCPKVIVPKEPSGLRWTKNNLRYFIDWRNFGQVRLGRALARQVIAKQTRKISGVCALDMRETRIRSSADFIIQFEEIDGEGGTLAFVPLPRNSEFVDVCRGCGGVHYDLKDIDNATDFGNVMLHELTHTAGIHHSDVRTSYMYPSYRPGTGEILVIDPWTLNEFLTRYPLGLA